MSQELSGPRTRGRPRSAESRRRALAAAREILLEEGLGRLTMDEAARRSGVGKPTLYRNWANASELAMAALLEGDAPPGTARDEPLAPALRRQIGTIIRVFATTRGRQIALALAAADPESEMTRAFRTRVILSSRAAGLAMIESAAARGEIAAPEAPELVADMIYAPIFYRLLLGHQPLDEAFAAALTETALALLGAEPQRQ